MRICTALWDIRTSLPISGTSRTDESRRCRREDKPGSGMARGELRSTLSRAGPCRCSALFLPTENPWDIITVFFAE